VSAIAINGRKKLVFLTLSLAAYGIYAQADGVQGNCGVSYHAEVTREAEVLRPQAAAVTHAVILVGGIYETSRYFDAWVPALASSDTVVFGWDHDHRTKSMPESAKVLARRIDELRAEGITDVMLIAHSMGGLVAKGAIDELSRTGEAERFSHLRVCAFGTPWGGYTLADLALIMPWSESISRLIGYPMGPDIGPDSAYMKSLASPLPPNAELNIYVGSIDDVALPDTRFTKARYKSVEVRASAIMTIEGFNHVEYNKASAELLNALSQRNVKD
jgi:pimeloyl-ACP methyl ester carboxylesterase